LRFGGGTKGPHLVALKKTPEIGIYADGGKPSVWKQIRKINIAGHGL
jgi:hypothetical protein